MNALANFVSDLSKYKTIAIFGYGVEGKSFYEFAKKYIPDVKILIVDKSYSDKENYLDDLNNAELVIKSPGISLYNLGISPNKYNFTSITELFLKYFGSYIIGVTGTKGKSTLVTLIANMLRNANKKALLCGNIGISPLEIIEKIDRDTTVVMELSSHQLHNIKYSPHIAILTNLFAEHLDYYESKDEYYRAKFNIFLHQKTEDIFITNLQNKEKFFPDNSVNVVKFYNVFTKELKYKHSFNIKQGYIHTATLQILEQLAELLDINSDAYQKTLNEFKTLPHRLEYVDTINDIIYINDSISTIPQACMEAVKILNDVDTVIVGGYDRGIDYNSFVDFLIGSDILNIVCFSDTGKQIYEKIREKESFKNIFYMQNLQDSVKKAGDIAKRVVLFSPAASSFNEYKNFMQRGEEFKKSVKDLKG